jgi:hypothetical protein
MNMPLRNVPFRVTSAREVEETEGSSETSLHPPKKAIDIAITPIFLSSDMHHPFYLGCGAERPENGYDAIRNPIQLRPGLNRARKET